MGIEFAMKTIEKTNKPDSFADVYQLANPLPSARPKVPVIDAKLQKRDIRGEMKTERIVLCESTVITDFLANIDDNHQLLPQSSEERAKIRLFMELCGSTFNSYVPFLRVQNEEQLQREYAQLQDKMKQLDAFLAASSSQQTQKGPFLLGQLFTLAEIHMAPFVQRCCEQLPPPYDPLSICKELCLTDHLQPWIQTLLERDSVVATASFQEMEVRRQKMINRLGRIQNSKSS